MMSGYERLGHRTRPTAASSLAAALTAASSRSTSTSVSTRLASRRAQGSPIPPSHVHRVPGPAHVPGPGHHLLVQPRGHRPAVRVRRRGRPVRDRPYLHRATRPRLYIGYPQTLHAEQC